MLRAMYSGVSGLRSFQTKLDVIGNNIANVNTIGFKKSRIMFQDALSQNIAGATAPNAAANRGGVNPRQIGLGVQTGAIDTIHTPGSPMTTGVLTDLSIAGDGFFLVAPLGVSIDGIAKGTDPGFVPYLTRAGNFTRDAEGYLVTSNGMYVLGTGIDNNSDGVLDNFNTLQRIKIDPNKYVSYDIDQYGVVKGYSEDGTSTELGVLLLGFVTNPGGLKKVGNSLYELTNNAHVEPAGQYWWRDYNSSDPNPTWVSMISERETTTQIISGQLEMSNVDLAEEFTEMIIAQRGFQANTRIITTSDEVLQELVNLKR
jgi:flagellar hook protein FlgE